MAISRSQQSRQNYGLGSFVKKAVNKVTRPFTKVAQKIVPKEIAGIARVAAPFVSASSLPAGLFLSALGQAKQRGSINPLETILAAAPGINFGGGQTTGIGRFKPSGFARFGQDYGSGENLRQMFLSGDNPLLGDKYGTRADEFLFGRDDIYADVQGPREAVPGSFGDTFDITKEGPGLGKKLIKGEKGILGVGGKFDLFGSKAADLAIRKTGKDGKTKILSPLKLGSWGLSIYSGIAAKKYKDEMEAAEAAEEALLAADSAASEADIAEAREWAQTVFGRLSRADIGLAQGGRVNYALGTGNPLPSDPTAPVNPFKPKPIGPVLPNKEMAMSYGYDDAMSDTYNLFLQMKERKEIPIDMDFEEFLMEVVPEMSKKQTMEDKPMAANGGLMRTNYALGTKPEPKESGLGGLPIEADMRYSGGFMPYGKKEKADDVPARLSKNEFVFTADAVRAAGGGSMNEGARKMYQTMKMLEQKNRMMS